MDIIICPKCNQEMQPPVDKSISNILSLDKLWYCDKDKIYSTGLRYVDVSKVPYIYGVVDAKR